MSHRVKNVGRTCYETKDNFSSWQRKRKLHSGGPGFESSSD